MDFNTDFLKRDNVNVVQTYRFLKKLGLKQEIDQVTRPNRKGGSCIDWIITDCAFVRESGVFDDFVSDHYSVYCIWKKPKENCTHVTRTVRDYHAFDQNNFEHLLRNSKRTVFDANQNPEIQWQIMVNHIQNILSIMCPFKRVNSRKNKKPWITQDI